MMVVSRVPIQTADGVELAGWFRQGLAPGSDVPVLFIQGFPGGVDDCLGLAHRLAGYGITTLTYTHRLSGGRYSIAHEPANIDAALAAVREQANAEKYGYDPAKAVVGGWSYGGGNALAYAAGRPEVRRVFSIAGTDHGELAHALVADPALAQWFRGWFRTLNAPEGPVVFEIGPDAEIDSLMANPGPLDLRPQAPKLADRDILLVCGWDDEQVTVEGHVLPLYRALRAAGAGVGAGVGATGAGAAVGAGAGAQAGTVSAPNGRVAAGCHP